MLRSFEKPSIFNSNGHLQTSSKQFKEIGLLQLSQKQKDQIEREREIRKKEDILRQEYCFERISLYISKSDWIVRNNSKNKIQKPKGKKIS